jgi:hypothetical protein
MPTSKLFSFAIKTIVWRGGIDGVVHSRLSWDRMPQGLQVNVPAEPLRPNSVGGHGRGDEKRGDPRGAGQGGLKSCKDNNTHAPQDVHTLSHLTLPMTRMVALTASCIMLLLLEYCLLMSLKMLLVVDLNAN